MRNTEKFRLFCYFRLFRILKKIQFEKRNICQSKLNTLRGFFSFDE
jgi:hypothetical protein